MEAYLYAFLKDNNVNLVMVWNGGCPGSGTSYLPDQKAGNQDYFYGKWLFSRYSSYGYQGVNAKNLLTQK